MRDEGVFVWVSIPLTYPHLPSILSSNSLYYKTSSFISLIFNLYSMCGGKGCGVSKLAWWLLAIGGLNWGLVGLGGFFGGNWNVVNLVLGAWPMVEWVVYVLVGVAAVASLVGCKCSTCKAADGRMHGGAA